MVRLIFKLRIARVAGANHLAVSFDDPGLEKARQAAQAAAPVPVNKAALEYITERNSKRDRFPIFHSTGCGSRRTRASSRSWVCVRCLSKTPTRKGPLQLERRLGRTSVFILKHIEWYWEIRIGTVTALAA